MSAGAAGRPLQAPGYDTIGTMLRPGAAGVNGSGPARAPLHPLTISTITLMSSPCAQSGMVTRAPSR
jgi:hypothetical protein